MNVESDDIQTKVTDNRGRIDLGTEYANKHVTIAVVNVENDIPVDDELAAAYRDATVSARRITHESESASDEPWDSLGPAPRVEGYDEDQDA